MICLEHKVQALTVLFLWLDVSAPEAGRKPADGSVANGSLASRGKQNGDTQVTVQRKRLLKAPTLAELDSSDSEVKHQDGPCFLLVRTWSYSLIG